MPLVLRGGPDLGLDGFLLSWGLRAKAEGWGGKGGTARSGRTQRAQIHGMNAVGQHPVPAMGTGTQSCLQPVGEGAGLQEEAPGGGRACPGFATISRTCPCLDQVLLVPREANSGPWKSPNCHWQQLEDGIVRWGGCWGRRNRGFGSPGTGLDSEASLRRYPPTHASPTRPLWGSQHCRTSHRLLSFGLFCSESDAHLPAGAMCTVTPR